MQTLGECLVRDGNGWVLLKAQFCKSAKLADDNSFVPNRIFRKVARHLEDGAIQFMGNLVVGLSDPVF